MEVVQRVENDLRQSKIQKGFLDSLMGIIGAIVVLIVIIVIAPMIKRGNNKDGKGNQQKGTS